MARSNKRLRDKTVAHLLDDAVMCAVAAVADVAERVWGWTETARTYNDHRPALPYVVAERHEWFLAAKREASAWAVRLAGDSGKSPSRSRRMRGKPPSGTVFRHLHEELNARKLSQTQASVLAESVLRGLTGVEANEMISAHRRSWLEQPLLREVLFSWSTSSGSEHHSAEAGVPEPMLASILLCVAGGGVHSPLDSLPELRDALVSAEFSDEDRAFAVRRLEGRDNGSLRSPPDSDPVWRTRLPVAPTTFPVEASFATLSSELRGRPSIDGELASKRVVWRVNNGTSLAKNLTTAEAARLLREVELNLIPPAHFEQDL